MAKRNLPFLSVVSAGTQRFQRWQITDERRRLWTGERFADSKGLLFASHNLAAIEAEAILRSCIGEVASTSYEAPTVIEVLGNDPVPQTVVANYLSKFTRMILNRSEHGYGPEGSVVLSHIDWSRMHPLIAGTVPAPKS
jgi:hypothetical protein